MSTAEQLRNSDFCPCRAWYEQRWAVPSLSPKSILRASIERGLQSEGDTGEAAEEEAYRLATEVGIDTAETDLLGIATHIAAFANFTAWVLRGSGGRWKRPEPVLLPDGTPWQSGAFLSATESHLRRVVLVKRWDGFEQMSLENSWEVAGECAVYQVPMDCLIVEIGSLRRGRWVNPFTVGYRHPVSKTLRFRKRDGEDFGATWHRVQREKDSATREEWLDALVGDGLLPEVIQIHSVDVPRRADELRDLAARKLQRMRGEKPDENLSACFQRIHPCPFRSCCPNGEEPSPERGFVPITAFSSSFPP